MKILLFDYDGTIVDSLPSVVKVYNKIAPKYGLQVAKSKEDFTEIYESNFYESLKKRGLKPERGIDFIREFREPLVRDIKKMKVFPKMKEVVEKLSKKHKIIVITSNITELIKNSIEFYGLNGIDDVLGEDKGLSKIDKILSMKKKFSGAEFFYIGDTIGDMKEAKEAGVKSVGVTWGYHSKEKMSKIKPDFIVNKPEELLKILINFINI